MSCGLRCAESCWAIRSVLCCAVQSLVLSCVVPSCGGVAWCDLACCAALCCALLCSAVLCCAVVLREQVATRG